MKSKNSIKERNHARWKVRILKESALVSFLLSWGLGLALTLDYIANSSNSISNTTKI